MKREELAREIYKISHITGEFKLRSGIVSNEYFDKYLFKHSNYTMKHIKYMTQRKIAVKFAKFLYTEFYKIENGE